MKISIFLDVVEGVSWPWGVRYGVQWRREQGVGAAVRQGVEAAMRQSVGTAVRQGVEAAVAGHNLRLRRRTTRQPDPSFEG